MTTKDARSKHVPDVHPMESGQHRGLPVARLRGLRCIRQSAYDQGSCAARLDAT